MCGFERERPRRGVLIGTLSGWRGTARVSFPWLDGREDRACVDPLRGLFLGASDECQGASGGDEDTRHASGGYVAFLSGRTSPGSRARSATPLSVASLDSRKRLDADPGGPPLGGTFPNAGRQRRMTFAVQRGSAVPKTCPQEGHLRPPRPAFPPEIRRDPAPYPPHAAGPASWAERKSEIERRGVTARGHACPRWCSLSVPSGRASPSHRP